MAREQRPQQPWYRSSAATFAAGLLGLAVIAGLVLAVIKMSGQWNTGETGTVLPPGTHLPEPPHFAATTTSGSSSTTYTTVRLSTTDIGLPNESSTTTTTSSPTDTPASSEPPPPATAPTFPGTFPTRVTHPPGTRGQPRPSR